MPLPSTVGQKTKKWWSKFVEQTVSFKGDQKTKTIRPYGRRESQQIPETCAVHLIRFYIFMETSNSRIPILLNFQKNLKRIECLKEFKCY